MVHSADAGTVMVIPRENRLVRLYIQLKEVSAGAGRVDRSTITPDLIFKAAQKILSPYSIKYHYIDWYAPWRRRRPWGSGRLTDRVLGGLHIRSASVPGTGSANLTASSSQGVRTCTSLLLSSH